MQLRPEDRRLLQLHRKHIGLYARIAKKFKVTAGYVSRIARGERTGEAVMRELLRELRALK